MFRVLCINNSGVFLFLSYSPILVVYIVFLLIFVIGVSMWSCFFDILTALFMLILLLSTITILLCDSSLDALRGLFDNIALLRVIQYCFIWFVLSEIALFGSLFYATFSLGLFLSLEFSFSFFCVPTMYSVMLTDLGCIFYWFFLDLFSIIINTIYLFVSGLFCNVFLIFTICRYITLSRIFSIFSITLGFLFIWNQMWEFSLLNITLSTNAFCSSLFIIDMLHFLHVSYGVLSIFLIFLKLNNTLLTDGRIILCLCIILYWHFVDVVWFFLLRFIYFDILCIIFLM